MAPLSAAAIRDLLRTYMTGALPAWEAEAEARPQLFEQLAVYLDLLLRWNARMNLSAIGDPEEVVRRHFGESLFLGWHLGADGSVLDVGSGAGFPGLPVQLWHPERRVTLAESQGKKSSFLRELVRTLGLDTEVWAGRVEALPSERIFADVVMRAVDKPSAALRAARTRARRSVWVLATEASMREIGGEGEGVAHFALPESQGSRLFQIQPVPRGT